MNITKTRQLSSFLLSQLLLGLPNKPRQYSTYIVITGGWLIFIEKVNGCVIPEREYKREHCCANGKPKLPTTMSPNYVLKHTHSGTLSMKWKLTILRQNMYKKESKLFRRAINVLI